MKKQVWVSVHDYTSAKICINAGVDSLLVGDSLGNTVYGFASPKQVTMEMMLAHAEAVQRAVDGAVPMVVDMPYGSYKNPIEAVCNAERFAGVGIQTLKMEGGVEILPQIDLLIEKGFDVVGHLGFLPQTAERFIAVKTNTAEAEKLVDDFAELTKHKLKAIVFECIEKRLVDSLVSKTNIPIIGIGAGDSVDGQVLVYNDIIGRTDPNFNPVFLRRFGNSFMSEETAIAGYVKAVRFGDFPIRAQGYH